MSQLGQRVGRRWGGRVHGARVAIGIVENSDTQVGHGACRPPGVAETVEKGDALLDLVSGTVNVDL